MEPKLDFNLFLLLDLDPTESWNQAEFEQRLNQKRGEWSRLTHNPSKKGKEAERNLGKIPELKAVAADPTKRAEHAKAAHEMEKAGAAEKEKELEDKLTLLQANGVVYETELKKLIKEYTGHFSEKEIRGRIKVPIKKQAKSEKPTQEPLDTTTAGGIQARLDILGRETLYDFLDADERTDPSILLKRYSDKYTALVHKANKNSDETTAWELLGHCKTIFSSAEQIARYNETLRRQKYDNLRKRADSIANLSETKVITAPQMTELLRGAKAEHLNPEDAFSILKEHAYARRYLLELPEGLVQSVARLQECGYCREINEAGTKHCTRCGNALKEACPRCGTPGASSSSACGNCGFPLGNRAWVVFLIDEAKQAVKDRDFKAALNHVKDASQVWPTDGKGPLAEQLATLEKSITPQKQAQERLIQELQTLKTDRRFYAARVLFGKDESKQLLSANQAEAYKAQIDQTITDAEQNVGKANRAFATGDLEQAVQYSQEALSICKDSADARTLLEKVPPAPPAILTAVLGEKVVNLSWQPSPSKNVAYSIVRKKGTRPISVNDGERLATIAGTIYDDIDAESGILLYYAIFTDREGVSSKESAVLHEPILIVRNVTDVVARVNDRQVHLSWTPPPNVHEVQVIRSTTNLPHSILDGQNIPVLSNDQAVDNSVENDRPYYYHVFSRFKDVNGKLLTTDGVGIKAIPQVPPSPIDHIEIEATGVSTNRIIHLRWVAPKKGDVAILKADKPTGLEFGSVLRRADLNRYDGLVVAHADGYDDRLDQPGVYYYLPVVLFGDVAYIGREHRFASADDVTNLKVQNMGHVLRLQWDWPKNCTEAIVAYNYNDWPTLESGSTVKARLTRSQYNLNGYFDIQNPKPADHYITVFAVIGQGGQSIVSSGLAPSARKLMSLQSRLSLTFEIVKPSFLKKHHVLSIHVNGQGELPALILTGKSMSLPMTKSDGMVLINIPPQQVNNDQIRIDLPGHSRQSNLYARLFPQNDDDLDRVRIQMPDPNQVRF